MKIYKLNLSLKECLDKEWIVTNGIGGYSSSTICFANTRRYHGLLVAPTKRNGIRRVFLSKIDEALIIGEDKKEHRKQEGGITFIMPFTHRRLY